MIKFLGQAGLFAIYAAVTSVIQYLIWPELDVPQFQPILWFVSGVIATSIVSFFYD